MNIVFFVHPSFIDSQSMPKFAALLSDGMKDQGHTVSSWSPQPYFIRFFGFKKLRKWMGYIDQYIVFPLVVKNRLRHLKKTTLFVFSDQALGPWVPLVAKHPHVIHCHDFLAQRSALDEIPENPSSWTGKHYQAYIRSGYQKGKNFISVSEKTKTDLHRFLVTVPSRSAVVYNGLNQSFKPGDSAVVRRALGELLGLKLGDGYLLHVGGNLWYKNRLGVIEIYNAFRLKYGADLPLLMVGSAPSPELVEAANSSQFKSDILWLSNMNDEAVKMAYAGASAFLFPSLAEGFGWPIAEAMASGCPVVTTNEAPMTEVAGNAGFLIARRPIEKDRARAWAVESAGVVNSILQLSAEERKQVVRDGIMNANRFNTQQSLNNIEAIYSEILQSHIK